MRNDEVLRPLSGDSENYVYGLVIPPESSLEWTYLLEGGTGQGSTIKNNRNGRSGGSRSMTYTYAQWSGLVCEVDSSTSAIFLFGR